MRSFAVCVTGASPARVTLRSTMDRVQSMKCNSRASALCSVIKENGIRRCTFCATSLGIVQKLHAAMAAGRLALWLSVLTMKAQTINANDRVLEAMAAALIQLADNSIREFNAAADRVQVRAGAALAEEVRTAIDSMRIGLRAALETGGYKARKLVMEVHRAHSRCNFIRWFSAGLLAALALLFCGALLARLT